MMRLIKRTMTVAAVTVLAITMVTRTAQAGAGTGAAKVTASGNTVTATAQVESVEDAQTDDHLFDAVDKLGAKAKESNEVNLDKSMLGLAARKGGEKGDLAQKLDYIVVRDYTFARENEYNMDDLKPIFQKLDHDGWKHLVRSREQREMTDICVRQDSNGVMKEMVIISAEPKELSLIHLKGNVSLADMKNFGSMMKDEPSRDDLKPNHH